MYYGFIYGKGKKSIAKIINKNKKAVKKNGKIDEKNNLEEGVLDYIESDSPEGLLTEVKLTDKELQLLPLMIRQGDDGMGNRVFLAGQSLCGKSYLASQLAKDYSEMFPKNKIALISWVKEDKNLNEKNLGGKRFVKINIDESILDDPLTLEEFHDKIVIFDDIEHFPNKHVVNELMRFRNCCINAGRHAGIDTIIARQNLLDAHKTKDVLNNCMQVVLFPHSSSRYQARQWLERYLFLPKKLIAKILNVPSRWVLINTTNPTYALHEKGAFMLNSQ